MSRLIGTALVTALLLWPMAPASAQQAKCLAGKTGCMAKKAAGLLKCEALAETPGKPADPNAKDCVTKVRTKFDGGLQPAKSCFEKLESKEPNDCVRFDDTARAEEAVDACVAALVGAIDPPPLDQTKCGAGKKKCASKYLAGLLKCRKLAQTPGKPADPNTKGCVDKAVAKYTGGLDPTKGCFEKLQAKTSNGCQSTTDSPVVKLLAEDCAADLVASTTLPPFVFVQTFSAHCLPFNYKTLETDLSFPSFKDAFAYCALQCAGNPICSQIYVGYEGGAPRTGPYAECVTGNDESVDPSKGWNGSEFQCGLGFSTTYADWYNRTGP